MKLSVSHSTLPGSSTNPLGLSYSVASMQLRSASLSVSFRPSITMLHDFEAVGYLERGVRTLQSTVPN